jgi:hypothetical protein
MDWLALLGEDLFMSPKKKKVKMKIAPVPVLWLICPSTTWT